MKEKQHVSARADENGLSMNKLDKTNSAIPTEFNGKWRYIHNNSRRTFTNNLSRKNDSILGSHCFVGMAGNRIDCANGTVTVKGILNNTAVVYGTFYSEYQYSTFRIKMKILSDTLYFTLEGEGADQLFYSPQLKFVRLFHPE